MMNFAAGTNECEIGMHSLSPSVSTELIEPCIGHALHHGHDGKGALSQNIFVDLVPDLAGQAKQR
jgi:hypothetical protein